MASRPMSIADRLRELAEGLPPGASLTLTRDGLLELAADVEVPHGEAPPVDFTVVELAAQFHRSPSTIREWCEQGRFDGAYKLNERDWRISQSAVDAFLARQRDRHRNKRDLRNWRRLRAKSGTSAVVSDG